MDSSYDEEEEVMARRQGTGKKNVLRDSSDDSSIDLSVSLSSDNDEDSETDGSVHEKEKDKAGNRPANEKSNDGRDKDHSSSSFESANGDVSSESLLAGETPSGSPARRSQFSEDEKEPSGLEDVLAGETPGNSPRPRRDEHTNKSDSSEDEDVDGDETDFISQTPSIRNITEEEVPESPSPTTSVGTFAGNEKEKQRLQKPILEARKLTRQGSHSSSTSPMSNERKSRVVDPVFENSTPKRFGPEVVILGDTPSFHASGNGHSSSSGIEVDSWTPSSVDNNDDDSIVEVDKTPSTSNRSKPDQIDIDSSEEEEADSFGFIVEDDEDSDSDVQRRMKKSHKTKDDADLDEITQRLKKQHVDGRKPKIGYIDGTPPNPFAIEKEKVERKNLTAMDPGRLDEYKNDVFKSAKLLLSIIDNIPSPDDDHSDFKVPRRLRIDLYPHQLYGTKWMCWRETVYPGGGILADEMGLGKTIMSIALILKGQETSKDNKENWFSAKNQKSVPSKATLVVCPVGCLYQWEKEIKDKARGLDVHVYHRNGKTSSASLLARSDVVLTTYQTLAHDIPIPDDDPSDRCRSPLFRIHWERVMLDEGHVIRNPKTHAAQSVCRLKANHRWIITGTPVHNRCEDFYSLVRFLQLEPFNDLKVWSYWIGTKVVPKSNQDRLNTVGRALLLRRTKEQAGEISKDVASLPPKTINDITITMTKAEDDVYQYVFNYAKSVMTKFLEEQKDRHREMQYAANKFIQGAQRKGKKNKEGGDQRRFSEILVLLTRLRQLAVLPYLIKTMLQDDDDGSDSDDDEYNPLKDPINTRNPVFEELFLSSKIKAVLNELRVLRHEATERGTPMDKVIVTSQWTSFLDILATHLDDKGYSYGHLDGRVDGQERLEIMDKFNKRKKPEILLLSITAGGVGLNLTGANHVFFMEPHWNPQIERQCQDRVHRYGQTKPVFIKRFLCDETLEQRILGIQAVKLDMADGLLDGAKKTGGAGLTVQDLKRIFDIN